MTHGRGCPEVDPGPETLVRVLRGLLELPAAGESLGPPPEDSAEVPEASGDPAPDLPLPRRH